MLDSRTPKTDEYLKQLAQVEQRQEQADTFAEAFNPLDHNIQLIKEIKYQRGFQFEQIQGAFDKVIESQTQLFTDNKDGFQADFLRPVLKALSLMRYPEPLLDRERNQTSLVSPNVADVPVAIAEEISKERQEKTRNVVKTLEVDDEKLKIVLDRLEKALDTELLARGIDLSGKDHIKQEIFTAFLKYAHLAVWRDSRQRKKGLPSVGVFVHDTVDTPSPVTRKLAEKVNTYLLDLLPPELRAQAEVVLSRLESEQGKVTFDEILKALEAEEKKQIALLLLDKDNQRLALEQWLKAKADKPKIAGTPEDLRVLDQIATAHNYTNGVASVIIFGPPGTGKTQLLIEQNRREGFGTRVISIHRHTDMVQLLGEPAIKLDLGQGAGALAQAEAALKLGENEQQFTAWINDLVQTDAKTLAKFADAIGFSDNLADLQTPEGVKQFRETYMKMMRAQVYGQLLIDEKGMNADAAWVNGEIFRAIEDGERVVLDEIEKTGSNEGGLNPITQFLTTSPGTEFVIGSKRIAIPSWFRVDATANQLEIPEHIHNRFPVTIFHGYPEPADLLPKVAMWTTNERGEIMLPVKTQVELVAVMTYIIPELQALYTDKAEAAEENVRQGGSRYEVPRMDPLSLRNLNIFTQDVVKNQVSVFAAVAKHFLELGSLTYDAGIQREMAEIVQKYMDMIELGHDFKAVPGSQPLKEAIIGMPSFEGKVEPVALSLQDRQQLKAAHEKHQIANSQNETTRLLPNGTILDIEGQTLQLAHSAHSGTNLFEIDIPEIKGVTAVESVSQDGAVLILRKNQELIMVRPFEKNKVDVTFGKDISKAIVSLDGTVSLEQTSTGTGFRLKDITTGRVKNIEIGNMRIMGFEIGPDSSTAVITTDRGTFKIDLQVERKTMDLAINLKRKTLLPDDGRWQFSGSLLWSPLSDTGFVLY